MPFLCSRAGYLACDGASEVLGCVFVRVLSCVRAIMRARYRAQFACKLWRGNVLMRVRKLSRLCGAVVRLCMRVWSRKLHGRASH